LSDVETCSGPATPGSVGYGLTRRQSSRSESSSDHQVDQLPDLNTDHNVDIDYNFKSWDPQILLPDLPLDFAWPLLDTELLPPFPSSDTSSDVSLVPVSRQSASIVTSLLQDYEAATTSFPDTYLLPIPALTLLRACLTIATRLGIAMQLWDCNSLSPFYAGSCPPLEHAAESSASSSGSSNGTDVDIASLPENLRPTRTQRQLPHHPLLDILPWPSVRDKLIMCFAQPAELRPARLGMEQLVADLEDEADGVVVKAGGAGPWEVERWEVGKALEKRWWFVLDAKVKRRR
jgi:hypothetical protein